MIPRAVHYPFIVPILVFSTCFYLRLHAQQLTWEHPYLTRNIAVGGTGCDLAFEFKNNSNQTIRITETQTSCGCSNAKIVNATTKPGEGGSIKVHFNRGKLSGEKKLTVLVKTDASEKTTTLNATILMPQIIQVRPAYMQWKIGETPLSKSAEVILADDFAGQSIGTAVTGAFNVRLDPTNQKTHYTLHVSPQSTAAPAKGTVTLQTNIADPGNMVLLHLLVKP
jgi:hypothetical protein